MEYKHNFKYLVIEIVRNSTYVKYIKEFTFEECLKYWKNANSEFYHNGVVHVTENSNISCVCTKKNLKYLFEIVNNKNGKLLIIGSSCIGKFGRQDMTDYCNKLIKEKELCNSLIKGDKKRVNIKYFRKCCYSYSCEYKNTDNCIYYFEDNIFIKKMIKLFDNYKIKHEIKKTKKIKGKSTYYFRGFWDLQKRKTINLQIDFCNRKLTLF